MLFLLLSRAVPDAEDREGDPALDEEHWSYIDRFADGMVARGPTLGPDRASWTGSIHILDLPSAGAVDEFLAREPYNRAGVYEQHVIRRFENLLGRTMWEHLERSGDPRFFAIAHASPMADEREAEGALRDLTGLPGERLIVHGRLLTPVGATPVGVALALQLRTRDAVHAFLADHVSDLDQLVDVEIFDWEFGGRR